MKRNNKKSLIIILLLLISLGYAYLNSELKINGTTGIKGNSWDVHFENVVPSSSNTVTPTIAPVANPQDKVTELTYSVRFNKPGDIYEFNVDIVNAGTIDGMIESFTSKIKIGNGAEQEVSKDTLPKYLKYYVIYSDGVNIKNNQLLNASTSETITVHIEYKEDITASDLLDSAGKTILLNINTKYTQATNEAIEKPLRLNCTYNGDLVNNAVYTNGQYRYQYNSSTDGWWVLLIDKDSTDPVTTPLCSTINGKPINDMSSMFYNSKATSIDLSSFDTSHVTNMTSMFSNTEIEELDLSSFNTENVSTMQHMFSDSKIKSIDISNFDMQKVTSIYGMFDNSLIESLDMSNLDMRNVKTLTHLCMNCNNLKYINLNNGGSDVLNNMSDMLYNSSNIEEIHMKNFNFGEIANLGASTGPFYNKQKLKVVDLAGAKMTNINLLYNTFYNCKELEELDLSNIYAPKPVQSVGYMFYNNVKLNNLDISGFDFSYTNTNSLQVFANVPATTVYVKDQANVDKLSSLPDKPSTMTFVVKP